MKKTDNSTIFLSLLTGPLLLGLLSIKSVTKVLEDLGEASEEIFRGDRLPILKFPDSKEN